MPPVTAAPSASPPPASSPPDQLAIASRALWLATLSLMTAFMQTPAPAHRLLLSRRIARNFRTLADQECFDSGCRTRFLRLAARWQSRAEGLEPQRCAAAPGLLDFLF